MATNIEANAPHTEAKEFSVDDYIEINDAAQALGVNTYHLREASKNGQLPVKILGSRTLISKANLKKFLDNGEKMVTRRNKPGAGGARRGANASKGSDSASANGTAGKHTPAPKETVSAA